MLSCAILFSSGVLPRVLFGFSQSSESSDLSLSSLSFAKLRMSQSFLWFFTLSESSDPSLSISISPSIPLLLVSQTPPVASGHSILVVETFIESLYGLAIFVSGLETVLLCNFLEFYC